MVDLEQCSGRPWLKICIPREAREHILEVCANPAGESPVTYRTLLGLLIAQAHTDGVRAPALGVTPPDGPMCLRYPGPTGAGPNTWFDMTPPPVEHHSALARAIVEATAFEPGFVPRGIMRVDLNHTPFEIKVETTSWQAIHLTWQLADCSPT